MHKPVIPAVSVALRRGAALLLVKRGRDPSKGLYAFPGGRVEDGETIEEAARREVLEETGLVLQDVRLLRMIELEAASIRYELHVFTAELHRGEAVAADDAEAAGWFTLDDMGVMPLTDSTRAIALELLDPKGAPAR
jgi:8-oxo-dGTP diphosphatase